MADVTAPGAMQPAEADRAEGFIRPGEIADALDGAGIEFHTGRRHSAVAQIQSGRLPISGEQITTSGSHRGDDQRVFSDRAETYPGPGEVRSRKHGFDTAVFQNNGSPMEIPRKFHCRRRKQAKPAGKS